MTPQENRRLGDLQEQNRILHKALENVLEAKTIDSAIEEAQGCLGALADVLSVQDYITPRIPTWIGIVFRGLNTDLKACIGINQEDGSDVSWRMDDDEEWITNNSEIYIRYGENERVFDNDNELIGYKAK
jgi:hypothetical protein